MSESGTPCLCVCPCVYVSMCLSVWLHASALLLAGMCVCVCLYLSMCLWCLCVCDVCVPVPLCVSVVSVCVSLCLYLYLSVCLWCLFLCVYLYLSVCGLCVCVHLCACAVPHPQATGTPLPAHMGTLGSLASPLFAESGPGPVPTVTVTALDCGHPPRGAPEGWDPQSFQQQGHRTLETACMVSPPGTPSLWGFWVPSAG